MVTVLVSWKAAYRVKGSAWLPSKIIYSNVPIPLKDQKNKRMAFGKSKLILFFFILFDFNVKNNYGLKINFK